jgi:hypothetical protein
MTDQERDIVVQSIRNNIDQYPQGIDIKKVFFELKIPQQFSEDLWAVAVVLTKGNEYIAESDKWSVYIKKNPSYNKSQTIITGDVTNSNINQVLSDKERSSPITQTTNSNTLATPPKRSRLEIASWIFGITVALVGIYEFVLKRILHLWN